MLLSTQLLLSQKDQKNTLTYCFHNWLAVYWDGADGGFDRADGEVYLHFGVCSVCGGQRGKKGRTASSEIMEESEEWFHVFTQAN